MLLTADTFRKLENDLSEKFMDKERIGHKLWKVPARFCALQYVNDARYLPRDTTLEIVKLNKP